MVETETETQRERQTEREREKERQRHRERETERELTQKRGLEEGFRGTEPLVAQGDDLTVRQLVALLHTGRRGGAVHLLLKVHGHVAQLLLHVTHDLQLGCTREAFQNSTDQWGNCYEQRQYMNQDL